MTSATPDWLNPVPFGDVGHGQIPGDPQQWDVLSEDQLQQMRKQLLESVLASVVQAVQGLFVPGPFGAALDQLSAWANNLPTFAQVIAEIERVTGLVFSQGPINFLESLFVSIDNAVSINLSSPQALVDSIIDLLQNAIGGAVANIQDVLNAIGSVLGFPAPPGFDLGEIQAWVSQNVFGFINPDRLPIIPVSHIGNTAINLLSNPQFSDVAIYDPSDTWTVDTAVNHSGVAGSATTICSEDIQELLSTDLIGVAVGQKLDVVAWVKMAGVVASAPDAIQLGVTTFTTVDGSGPGTVVNLSTVSTYGTQDWAEMRGVYTVSGDVKTLRVRIAVSEAATAGQVWFDDMWCAKQGLLPISLVEELGDRLADLLKLIQDGLADLLEWVIDRLKDFLRLDDWQSFINNVWAALTGKPVQPDIQITANDAADQLALNMATLAAQNTNLAQLLAQINKPEGGLVAYDDFERADSNSLGTGWTVTELLLTDWGNPVGGNGFFCIRNGQAMWRDEGPVGNRVKVIRADPKDALTKTPWQAITRVTGMVIAESPKAVASAADFIYGRVSANGKQYIVAWTDAYFDALDGGWKWRMHLGYNVGSGDKHFVDTNGARMSVTVDRPSAGATYVLQCGSLDNGDADDQYRFRVLRDNRVIIEFLDKSRVSAAVANNKGWGFGGAAQPWLLSQLTPSSLHSITVMDLKAP